MFNLLNKIPDEIGVAFSGGVDSIALFHFLNRKKNVTLFFFDHENEISEREKMFVINFAKQQNAKLVIGKNSRAKFSEESKEEYWRKMRYSWFTTLDIPIAMGHHLDDAVETWLWGCFNGQPQLHPYSHANVIRPFLLTKKQELMDYCAKHKLSWFEDISNKNSAFTRNRIRNNILPEVLKVNPGIHKVIKKKLIEKYKVS